MILDVACGIRPQGDVNLDLHPDLTRHRSGTIINILKTPNFIQASAEHLPFRDNMFSESVCSHFLEHSLQPTQTLLEMIRVTTRKITFIVPHRYSGGYHKHLRAGHRWFFNNRILNEWLQKLKINGIYTIELVSKSYPHRFLHIIDFPYELKVTILLKTEKGNRGV